jgi:hypothetical protein
MLFAAESPAIAIVVGSHIFLFLHYAGELEERSLLFPEVLVFLDNREASPLDPPVVGSVTGICEIEYEIVSSNEAVDLTSAFP